MSRNQDRALNKFIEERNNLIKKLECGILDKKQFLDNNYALIERLEMKPYLKVDNFQKGIYNYQYYNILAKYYHQLAGVCRNHPRKRKRYNLYHNMSENYYHEKDKAVMALLDFEGYQDIEAYYIQLHSTKLQNQLYEILFKGYSFAVFHSKCPIILEKLRAHQVFDPCLRDSVIHDYVNRNY